MSKQQALGSTIFASTIGTVVEWYDFILYAMAAALILNHLFFPQFDPTTGIIASFATYTVSFLVHPLGGIVFGWMGDRIGPKPGPCRKIFRSVALCVGHYGCCCEVRRMSIRAPVNDNAIKADFIPEASIIARCDPKSHSMLAHRKKHPFSDALGAAPMAYDGTIFIVHPHPVRR